MKINTDHLMKRLSQLLTIISLFALTNPTGVFAKVVDTAIGKIDSDPVKLVSGVLRFALGIGGGIAFLLIVFGGFKLTFSQGNPDNLQAGRDMITSAIVGLLIIIFSTFLLRLIGIDILGLPASTPTP